MLTVAIETSGMRGSIALRCDGELLDEQPLRLEKRHAQTLVPDLRDLLARHGYKPHDCQLLGVSVGPGSFTGLRVGIVCAKTFAYVVGCPIAAVETLPCIAHNAPPEVNHLHVVMNAQREELFLARFERTGAEEWRAPGQVSIVKAREWIASLTPEDVVTGPGLERQPADLAARCRVLPEECWIPRAAWVGVLAERQLAAGLVTDAWSLQPLYIRKSAAEEKWEARQSQASEPGAETASGAGS